MRPASNLTHLSDVDLHEPFQICEARSVPCDHGKAMGKSSCGDHAIKHMGAGATSALDYMAQHVIMGVHAGIVERNTSPES